MLWSQFSTKILDIAILDIKDWDINKCQYSGVNAERKSTHGLWEKCPN